MKGTKAAIVTVALALAVVILGCGRQQTKRSAAPVFSLAWSEYPSWSTFGVAHEFGLIDGRKGEMGPIEKKWGVDIVLIEADYDSCIQLYGAGKCDAACLTNMDILNGALRRPAVGILPTSTSYGADALIVTPAIESVQQLRGKNVYGLAKTVSEYCFVRNLEILGEREADHRFTNMDPAAAATALQQKREGYDAIMVWNLFVLETLNKRTDTRRLFDSTMIPGEIVDMVQMAQESLDRPGGKEFACAIIETFYAVCERMDNPTTRGETLVKLGEKFANLDLKSMEIVCTHTSFYCKPEEGIKLLIGDEWAMAGSGLDVIGDPFKAIMNRVVQFCVMHDIVPEEPTVGYGARSAANGVHYRLDPEYIREYLRRR